MKLKAATASLDTGTYIAPSKMTIAEWMDIWVDSYLNNVKPRTVEIYTRIIRNHIKPSLGAIRLEALDAHKIQMFYNSCSTHKQLAPKTVKDIHGVLHKALQQAVASGYIRFNPSDACVLPRADKQELKPLDDDDIAAFLKVIEGSRHEVLLAVTLFTGMREGEVLGLTWDCIDFDRGTITINKQLQYVYAAQEYQLIPTKNSKIRIITPANFVMDMLKQHRKQQNLTRMRLGAAWAEGDFVFTDAVGKHLHRHIPYRAFKLAVSKIGRPEARFHDLRHTYAVAALRSGDDIKTVQGNLGHATASFTLDVYGHVTDQMKKESADRMDRYIKKVTDL